jgi:uncharacterized protein
VKQAPGVTPFEAESVRGYLHHPAGNATDGIVLTHGAGGNCEMPLLVILADAFSQAGVTVLRCDLPFRQKRKFGAPSPAAAAADRAGLKSALNALRPLVPGRLFLGGQSYGGRQASMLLAEEPQLASALVLLSYPLHPPGKPEQLRVAHFPSLRTPSLFVSGSRDPFGTLEELRNAIAAIPAPAAVIEVEGAGHELARGKFDVTRLVLEPLRKLTASGRTNP